jgi:hypothetical protein
MCQQFGRMAVGQVAQTQDVGAAEFGAEAEQACFMPRRLFAAYPFHQGKVRCETIIVLEIGRLIADFMCRPPHAGLLSGLNRSRFRVYNFRHVG